jgi:hypothetical protein
MVLASIWKEAKTASSLSPRLLKQTIENTFCSQAHGNGAVFSFPRILHRQRRSSAFRRRCLRNSIALKTQKENTCRDGVASTAEGNVARMQSYPDRGPSIISRTAVIGALFKNKNGAHPSAVFVQTNQQAIA